MTGLFSTREAAGLGVASLLVTAAVATLVATNSISPEWFFVGAALPALVTALVAARRLSERPGPVELVRVEPEAPTDVAREESGARGQAETAIGREVVERLERTFDSEKRWRRTLLDTLSDVEELTTRLEKAPGSLAGVSQRRLLRQQLRSRRRLAKRLTAEIEQLIASRAELEEQAIRYGEPGSPAVIAADVEQVVAELPEVLEALTGMRLDEVQEEELRSRLRRRSE